MFFLIKSEIATLNRRNKILKIAYDCDTVQEYLDNPLADSDEDAKKVVQSSYEKENTTDL